MQGNTVKDFMTRDPVIVSPDDSLQEASRKMKEVGCGILPVGTKDKIEGMITDRDIVIRALAEGRDPASEKVRSYMTNDVYSCTENESVQDAAAKMRECGVGRLVVMDGSGKVCGIVTFGAILRKDQDSNEVLEVVECATGRGCAASPMPA